MSNTIYIDHFVLTMGKRQIESAIVFSDKFYMLKKVIVLMNPIFLDKLKPTP